MKSSSEAEVREREQSTASIRLMSYEIKCIS